VDEEQKFGVSAKEKLKALRVNVDTLTLTATPIPRTLQFSLMGVRELSVIATPPPNRHPIQTEVSAFDKELIKQAIEFEVSRGGQVFFINNRVENLREVESMIRGLCPQVATVSAHGQMNGEQLEKIMLDFIAGDYNVLVSTSIIEAGLDIPNANTIIINNAHMFGLSDLHQLRGRVGRSNKQAFCYLLAPPLTDLTPEARRRLSAIEEFADLGSGFNIAMQDLDIRGAGNLMGAEQSGFIAEIGFETYHHILNEAMNELREEGTLSLPLTPSEGGGTEDSTSMSKPVTVPVSLPFGEGWGGAGGAGLAGGSFITCEIDTDLELLLPDAYVENVSERVYLYRELDNIKTEERLAAFEQSLIDRFGDIPPQGKELINVVRLRWKAASLGVEKIVLRNSRMLAYFIANPKSPFFQSATFTRILQSIQQNPRLFRLKEAKDKLAMSVSPVEGVQQAMQALEKLG
jgi:transcription-repair coupling factor (superfamily II helicase)